jgi:endonuclease/exonuclease/phosphatase family metal-dependent hydrolase
LSGADTLRVMTYNILYDTSPTGGGSGAERWPLVVDGVRDAGADLVALQEVLPGRIAAIPRDLPEYRLAVSEPGGSGRAIGPLLAVSAVALVLLILRRRRHRDPAVRRGRMRRLLGHAVTLVLVLLVVGIPAALAFGAWYVGGYSNLNERLAFLYRPERMRLVEARTFWFSPTPEIPGTRGPFEFEPRIAQLGMFVLEPSGETLAVLNVHPGHSPAAHASSARLMRGVLDARWTGAPQLLVGDFNATQDSPRLVRLLEAGSRAPGFRDAWLAAESRSGPAGTFHWGSAQRDRGGVRIDHVLVRGPARVVRARTLGRTRGDMVASDHDALVVDLELPARAAADSDTLSR